MKCPSCKGDMTAIPPTWHDWYCRRRSRATFMVRWFLYHGKLVRR